MFTVYIETESGLRHDNFLLDINYKIMNLLKDYKIKIKKETLNSRINEYLSFELTRLIMK